MCFGPFGISFPWDHVTCPNPTTQNLLRESVNLLLRFESMENAGPFRGNLAIFRAFSTTFLPRLNLNLFFLALETHTASGEVCSHTQHASRASTTKTDDDDLLDRRGRLDLAYL